MPKEYLNDISNAEERIKTLNKPIEKKKGPFYLGYALFLLSVCAASSPLSYLSNREWNPITSMKKDRIASMVVEQAGKKGHEAYGEWFHIRKLPLNELENKLKGE